MRGWLVAIVVMTVLGCTLGATAPWLYAEIGLRNHGPLVGPRPSAATKGRWVDDYFVVQQIDESTIAIGEPRYYQGNYSYLILGTQRAVLFDAGTGTHDLARLVRSLTSLPVTILPSHLHFDHVGALGRLDKTALIDLPSLRERLHTGTLTLRRYEFLGFADGLEPPTFKVDEWWSPGSTVDLGGRQLSVLHTPGHTPTSVSLYDAARHQLFCGDFIYPGALYVFLPGASRSAYLASTNALLAALDPATRLYTAHMSENPGDIEAPVLAMADLRALRSTLALVAAHHISSKGFYPRVFEVRGPVSFATGFVWNNR